MGRGFLPEKNQNNVTGHVVRRYDTSTISCVRFWFFQMLINM